MTAPAGATIYYTTDGSDPRLPGYLSTDSKTITLVAERCPEARPGPQRGQRRRSTGQPHRRAFSVTFYKATGTVGSLTAAEAVIANASQQASTAKEQASVINYFNTGSLGEFGNDRPFPGTTTNVDVDNFVILVTGKVMIPQTGNWTFGVSSDDGFGLDPDSERQDVYDVLSRPAVAGRHPERVQHRRGGPARPAPGLLRAGRRLGAGAVRGPGQLHGLLLGEFPPRGRRCSRRLAGGDGNVWYRECLRRFLLAAGTGASRLRRGTGY